MKIKKSIIPIERISFNDWSNYIYKEIKKIKKYEIHNLVQEKRIES